MQAVKTVEIDRLQSPLTFIRPVATKKRELRDLRRKQSAEQAIEGFGRNKYIYALTKGQFSMLDLIKALLRFTGPADVILSTWTAARKEIAELDAMKNAGDLLSMRWLVDFTFARRDPAAADQIRKTFGLDAIRVSQIHAKFCLFQNADWRIVLQTSMNLNMNPRIEDFTIQHDPEIADFLQAIVEEIWRKQSRQLIDARPSEIEKNFRHEI